MRADSIKSFSGIAIPTKGLEFSATSYLQSFQDVSIHSRTTPKRTAVFVSSTFHVIHSKKPNISYRTPWTCTPVPQKFEDFFSELFSAVITISFVALTAGFSTNPRSIFSFVVKSEPCNNNIFSTSFAFRHRFLPFWSARNEGGGSGLRSSIADLAASAAHGPGGFGSQPVLDTGTDGASRDSGTQF